MGLPAAKARGVARRLKLRQSLEADILAACELAAELPALAGQTPSDLTLRLESVDLLTVYAVWRRMEAGELKESFRLYALKWRHIRPETDGPMSGSHFARSMPTCRHGTTR